MERLRTRDALAVVAFAAVMVGLFSPALITRDQEPPVVTCMSSGKQLANALLIYASDHDDRLPPGNAWYDAIQASFGSKKVFCPQAPSPPGYSLNSAFAANTSTDVVHPETTVLLFDSRLMMSNSIGTLADLAFRHDDAATICMADTSARRITRDRAQNLIWKDLGPRTGRDVHRGKQSIREAETELRQNLGGG